MYTEDCMKKFSESLREHPMEIINFKKKKRKLLINDKKKKEKKKRKRKNMLKIQSIVKLRIIVTMQGDIERCHS